MPNPDQHPDSENLPEQQSQPRLWVKSVCNFRVCSDFSDLGPIVPYEKMGYRFEFLWELFLKGLQPRGGKLITCELILEGMDFIRPDAPEQYQLTPVADRGIWQGRGTAANPLRIEIREEFLYSDPNEQDQEICSSTLPYLESFWLFFALEDTPPGQTISVIRMEKYRELMDQSNQQEILALAATLRIPGRKPIHQRFPLQLFSLY